VRRECESPANGPRKTEGQHQAPDRK
jgi:hypothetical protein